MIYIRRVAGNSMLPRYLPGQLIVAVRRRRLPRAGQVVIVEHEGKEKIKRVDRMDGQEVYVLGDHADASTDSRHFGWLPITSVKAIVIWPR